MTSTEKSLVLIGMPGSGKSSVGVLLAKAAGLTFVDSDIEIQTREKASLQTLLQRDGHLRLREIEEEVLLDLPVQSMVVATGGSAVYSDLAMRHLGSGNAVIYLRSTLQTVTARIGESPVRGIASDPGDSMADIYRERTPLYERYADHVVDVDSESVEDIVRTIMGLQGG